MKRLAYPLVTLLAVAACMIGSGCASPDAQRRDSDMPWNQPQPWEGSPYIPGMNRY